MKNRTLTKIIFLFLFLILFTSYVQALNWEYLPDEKSNESIQSKNFILAGEKCIGEMQDRGINLSRVNESLQQAIQFYIAEITLERKGVKTDYNLANDPAKEVCRIKGTAFQAQDELTLFLEKWNSVQERFNISSIKKDYDKIISSFNEERFEETITLIDQGYNTITEFESSQTSINLFYETTTRTIKDFFVNNWEILSISTVVSVILLLLFWKTIRRKAIEKKLEDLSLRKYSIEKLLKKAQGDYFNKKTMSETEYRVKVKTFGEMMMEINKKIPEMHEELAKINRKDLSTKKKKEQKNQDKKKEEPKKEEKRNVGEEPKEKKKAKKKSKFKKKRR